MTTVAHTRTEAHSEHAPMSFWRKYIFSTDHKIIGIQFLFVSLFFLLVGAHDMAFPRINMWSFWLALLAGLIMLAGFFVPDGAPRAGWTMYAPLSARPDLSGATISQKLWSISIVVLGLSSVMGSVNYITTIINHREPGMYWFRMPLSVWALFITAILAVLALPVLQGAAIMLLFDQSIGTHFFDPV